MYAIKSTVSVLEQAYTCVCMCMRMCACMTCWYVQAYIYGNHQVEVIRRGVLTLVTKVKAINNGVRAMMAVKLKPSRWEYLPW